MFCPRLEYFSQFIPWVNERAVQLDQDSNMQQGVEENFCSPSSYLCIPQSLSNFQSHLPTLQIWRFSIYLRTSLQHPSFKLRAQSHLNCPIILVESQSFRNHGEGCMHLDMALQLKLQVYISGRKEATRTKCFALYVPTFLYIPFLQKKSLLIPWLFKCHYHSNHK